MKKAPVFNGDWPKAKCAFCRTPDGCTLKSWDKNGKPIYWCSEKCHSCHSIEDEKTGEFFSPLKKKKKR